MKNKEIYAFKILEQLSTYDLWNISVREICQAIALSLDSKTYGFIKKHNKSEYIEMNEGLTKKSFRERLKSKAKPLFSMNDGKNTYRLFYFDIPSSKIKKKERASINTVLRMIAKALQMRSVSKDRIIETQIINRLNLNVTTALDEKKIVTTLETAARQMLNIGDIYLFYIINDVAVGSGITINLSDIPKKTYERLFRVQHIFTTRMKTSVFTRLAKAKSDPKVITFIPFTIKNELRGFFIIFRDILKKNKTYGITRLKFLANQAALALERIDLFKALNRTLKESQGIQELVKIMLSSLDLSSLFNEILQRAQKILGFNRILFSLLDEKTDRFKRVAGVGISKTKLKRAQKEHPPRSAIESLFRNRFRISNSYYIPARDVNNIKSAIKQYELYTHLPARQRLSQVWDPGDIFISPVYSKSRELVAILSLDKPVNNMVPTYEKIRLLETFGDFFGMAIENAQLFEKIEKLSNTDEMTGIYNYRFLREKVKELTRKKKTPFTIVLIDLDNFKMYNDRFGHVQGDMVLKNFAENLQKAIGKRGYAIRYGGDEFIMLLPGLTSQQTKKTMPRIQQYLSRHRQNKKRTPIKFTFGSASFPKHGRNLGALIDRADQILYERKSI